MSTPGEALRRAVRHAAGALRALGDAQASISPAPGKWSPKEVIGHLIDSASNNHGRFIRGQLADGLSFPGYAQDDWVRVQHYASADWAALVDLWELFNLHIARMMDLVPADVRMRPRTDRAFQGTAFGTLRPDEPATLDRAMHDYVMHLEHHLRRIDPALVAR